MTQIDTAHYTVVKGESVTLFITAFKVAEGPTRVLRSFIISIVLCTVAFSQTTSKITVFYTGKLLGYMRHVPHPANTPHSSEMCSMLAGLSWCDLYSAPNGDDRVTRWPDTLMTSRAKQESEGSRTLLLGMGDNLGPRYEDRFTFDCSSLNPCGWRLKKRNDSLTGISDDQAAEFLEYAHYDALVPGKEDFYLGAYRLKQLADLWVSSPQSEHPTFLAANLVLQAVPRKDFATKDSGKNYVTESENIDPQFTYVLPFATYLPFKITKLSAPPQVFACPAHGTPDDFGIGAAGNLSACTPVPLSTTMACPELDNDFGCVAISSTAWPADKSILKIPTAPLRSGGTPIDDWGVCFLAASSSPTQSKTARPFCTAVHFENPFFSKPYLLKCADQAQCCSEDDIAVFAVVESELKSYLAQLNDLGI